MQVGSVTSFWGLRNEGELSGRGFLEKLLLELQPQEMGTWRERPAGSLTEETKAQSRNLVAGITALLGAPGVSDEMGHSGKGS